MSVGKRKKVQFKLATDILIRIDYSEKIKEQYDNNKIYFGCPANWIDLAKKDKEGIADKFEAIFAHVKKGDSRLSIICDDGIPLNMFRGLWEDEKEDGTVFVRYARHCLIPTTCFFSVAAYQKLKSGKEKLIIDLRKYYKSLGYNQEECSLLVVKKPQRLFDELKQQIPNSLSKHANIRFDDEYDDKKCLLAKRVKYNLDINKEFCDLDGLRKLTDIYRKRKKYRPQREARLIIPKVYFTADPVFRKDAYEVNRLSVDLPNLKEYCIYGDAKDVNYLVFDDYNEETDTIRIRFSKEPE